jgi:hypothetical protein
MCAPPSCGTLQVCYAHQEQTLNPLRPLPALAALCVLYLSGDPSLAAHAGSPHTIRRNHEQSVVVVPLVQHVGPRFPIPRAGSSSEDQVQFECGQTEKPVWDRQGQR